MSDTSALKLSDLEAKLDIISPEDLTVSTTVEWYYWVVVSGAPSEWWHLGADSGSGMKCASVCGVCVAFRS